MTAPTDPHLFLSDPREYEVTQEDREQARAEALQADRAAVLRAMLTTCTGPRVQRWFTHAQLPLDPRPEPRQLSWEPTPWDDRPDPIDDINLGRGGEVAREARARIRARRRAWIEGHGFEGTELVQFRLRALDGAPLWIHATGTMGRIDPEYAMRGWVEFENPLHSLTITGTLLDGETRVPAPLRGLAHASVWEALFKRWSLREPWRPE
jgi:hypothetical protein